MDRKTYMREYRRKKKEERENAKLPQSNPRARQLKRIGDEEEISRVRSNDDKNFTGQSNILWKSIIENMTQQQRDAILTRMTKEKK